MKKKLLSSIHDFYNLISDERINRAMSSDCSCHDHSVLPPDNYPCVAVYSFDATHYDSSEVFIAEYIYPSDFELTK